MKTVFLHGLGQTAQDWKEVVQQLSISDVDVYKRQPDTSGSEDLSGVQFINGTPPAILSWWNWPSVRWAMWAAILIGAGMALTCLLYTS